MNEQEQWEVQDNFNELDIDELEGGDTDNETTDNDTE